MFCVNICLCICEMFHSLFLYGLSLRPNNQQSVWMWRNFCTPCEDRNLLLQSWVKRFTSASRCCRTESSSDPGLWSPPVSLRLGKWLWLLRTPLYSQLGFGCDNYRCSKVRPAAFLPLKGANKQRGGHKKQLLGHWIIILTTCYRCIWDLCSYM